GSPATIQGASDPCLAKRCYRAPGARAFAIDAHLEGPVKAATAKTFALVALLAAACGAPAGSSPASTPATLAPATPSAPAVTPSPEPTPEASPTAMAATEF